MSRKKKAADETAQAETGSAATAVAEPETTDAAPSMARPDYIDGPPVDEKGRFVGPRNPDAKNWGEPYKKIFSSKSRGFEMGEDRRFKQRVFKFTEKPAGDVLAALKEAGFTYRANEKAWTISATPDTRRTSEELARQFAGEAPGESAVMRSADFFKRFADDHEIGRDATDAELSVFYDNGREVGLWREQRGTTIGQGQVLGEQDAEAARHWCKVARDRQGRSL